MSNAPLPSQIDARKLAVKGAEINAEVRVSTLPRIADMLANDKGKVTANLRFYIDDNRKRRLDGHLSAMMEVTCQRCLEPMPLQLETEFALAIVWSEDDGANLPSDIDPLIVGEELIDLSDVVSEELILAMPFVSYHTTGHCAEQRQVAESEHGESADLSEDRKEERENPFKVLEQLKQNK